MAIDPVTLTQQLIRFDTCNPPGQEAEAQNFLADLLSSAGMDVRLQSFGAGRSNLVARPKKSGTGEDGLHLLLTGHIDTVPLGRTAWTRDPFGGQIEAGRLFGRGASDMKSGVAALIASLTTYLASTDAPVNVTLAITGGEETGCDGAKHLMEESLIDRPGLIIVAEPTSNRMLAGHKGALWMRACCGGRAAHGAMPHLGENAIYKLARLIPRLEDFDFNIARHPVMGPPTLNVGTIRGGENLNSVPDHAELTIDMRSIPEMPHAVVADQIADLLGEEASMTTEVDLPCVWSDTGHPVMKLFEQSHADATGAQPDWRSANFFTDASVFSPGFGGAQTVICGPGEPEMAHQTDEYCEVSRIGEAVAIYSRLLTNL